MGYLDIEWLLGSFRGRASRLHFVSGLMLVAIMAVLAVFAFRIQYNTFCLLDPQALNGRVYFTALGVVGAILTYSGTAVFGKRLQDRGMPGFLAVLPWLGLWVLPVIMRFGADGAACMVITPQRMMLAAGLAGFFGLVVLFCLLMPGSRLGNRFGDSLRKPPLDEAAKVAKAPDKKSEPASKAG